MKKSPFMLALLVFSAPLFFKNKLSAAEISELVLSETEQSKLSRVSSLIREYLTCGTDCPQKYKDALVKQIAKLRNINKKKALALIVIAFLAGKGIQRYRQSQREVKVPTTEQAHESLRKHDEQYGRGYGPIP